MKNSKKGISLIVLVITIVVIIILAAAVILSLNNNNLITNARRAVNENDFVEVESAWSIALQEVVVKQLDNIVLSGVITSEGMMGAGYAGAEPEDDSEEGVTPSTISQDAQDVALAIDIDDKLGLGNTFSMVVISDNRVVALVRNGQLYEKVVVKDENGVESIKVGVKNANYSDTVENTYTLYCASSKSVKKGVALAEATTETPDADDTTVTDQN